VKAAPKPAAAPVVKAAPAPAPAAPAHVEEGGASYYNAPNASECAHRSVPKGTVLTVTNLANGKSVTCKVNDRGPFVAGRVIDLSKQGFAAIASTSAGVIRVRVTW
jgi:rare lipoprotein A